MAGDQDHTLAEQVGQALTATESTVAVAESSTGGLVGSMITDVPGSSGYFDRSLVTYSNDAKKELLDVDPVTLEEHGAVSEETARQMACGVMNNAGTTWGVSTTGIAGPGGGTDAKPVGTIFIGTAQRGADGAHSVRADRYRFDGSRLECKEQFARQALRDLLEEIDSRR